MSEGKIENKIDTRYQRLTGLPEIGPEGLGLLQSAHVAIIGCGALGSLAAMYLAASGVGHISIADMDTVDISNLQRQLFFSEAELGQSKAEVLEQRMHSINSDVRITRIDEMITRHNADRFLEGCDVVLDGSDNPYTKLLTDRECRRLNIPCVIGGVRGMEGQVMTCLPGSVRYEDVFGDATECSGFMPCSIAGVLGPAAGVVASVQAAETIKIITRAGTTLADRLFTINLLNMSVNVFPLKTSAL